MEAVLEFAGGPLFAGCFAILVLGLLRLAVIAVWKIWEEIREGKTPSEESFWETMEWLIPLKHFSSGQIFLKAAAVIFYTGLVIVPLLLLDHILLWRHIGLSWPSIPRLLADILVLATVVAGFFLLRIGTTNRELRMSRPRIDYALIGIIEVILITGFIASRSWSPLSYDWAMLIHILCGSALMALIPFTKISNLILYPLVRMALAMAPSMAARMSRAKTVNKEN
jgi:uncharacterized membrane protein